MKNTQEKSLTIRRKLLITRNYLHLLLWWLFQFGVNWQYGSVTLESKHHCGDSIGWCQCQANILIFTSRLGHFFIEFFDCRRDRARGIRCLPGCIIHFNQFWLLLSTKWLKDKCVFRHALRINFDVISCSLSFYI